MSDFHIILLFTTNKSVCGFIVHAIITDQKTFGEDFKSFKRHRHFVMDNQRIFELPSHALYFFFNHRIMSKILKKLSYLDFPENSRQALQYVASCYSDGSTHHGLSIPGLESASENWAYEVCHEYIYFHSSSRRAAQVKKNL